MVQSAIGEFSLKYGTSVHLHQIMDAAMFSVEFTQPDTSRGNLRPVLLAADHLARLVPIDRTANPQAGLTAAAMYCRVE
jgi:hypothetical protein